jgi:competence protein ComEA
MGNPARSRQLLQSALRSDIIARELVNLASLTYLSLSLGEVHVRSPVSPKVGYGEWLFNVVVASISALVTALVVVGLSIFVDRLDAPGIEIVGQTGPGFIVQISGAVATPGVYDIPSNGRLADVVAAAGGLTNDAEVAKLNLAARLGDGEHITIPVISGNSDLDTEEAAIGSGLINVNTATVGELDVLPGVGPVIAGRIVDEREENGPFLTVDSLTRVDGISAGTLEELRPLVSVGD